MIPSRLFVDSWSDGDGDGADGNGDIGGDR